MAQIWTTERKIVLGFGFALLSLCVVAGVSVWLTEALLGDLSAVRVQNQTLAVISDANGLVPQMATFARLYAINHDEGTYMEWTRKEVELEDKLLAIEVATGDSATQRERLASIRRILREKVQVTTRDASREALDSAWGIRDGKSQMRPLTDLLIDMGDEEGESLSYKNEQATREAQAASLTIGIAFSLALLLIGGALFMILRDLKARRRAAEELERARVAAEAASFAKSAFLANMSHELRTPLTSILGYVDLMLDPGSAAAGRAEYLQTIRRSGAHLLNVINDVLDVSKIEAGRMGIEAVECAFVDILADVDSLMRTRAIEKAIEFRIEYVTPIPERVRTDPTRFRQILMNLAGNAVKFTDEGSVRIVVACREGPGDPALRRLVVEVIDTGVGISEAQQRQLFQPFVQADISTTRRFGGTGLGLSISGRLAQMLGGELTVKSQLHQGSTFTLSIPLEVAPGSAMITPGRVRELLRDPHSTQAYPRDMGLRVLLAEDGAENRDVILLHLRQAGCIATAVEDGQQAYESALRAARSGNPFDIVLMDMQMPVMDGYTATSKLRAEGYDGIIIALTAHALKEDRDRCLRVGCDEYAVKPFNIPELLQMMSRFSGRRGSSEKVVRQLMENPALRQLTLKFCDGIAAILEGLRALHARSAWSELAVAAHRLAGAGGAYGFDEITRDAKNLERAARAGDVAAIPAALELLARSCQAAQRQVLDVPDAAASAPDERTVAPSDAPAAR